MAKRWTDKETQIISKLLEKPNKYSYLDLARVLNRPVSGVRRICSQLNIQSHVRKIKSEGEEVLFILLRELYPALAIQRQYPIGERLHLDLHIPDLNLGFEFDGVQHSEESSFFHKDRDSFLKGTVLDDKKDNLCANQGIHLIRIDYKENLCKEVLMTRIEEIGPGPGIRTENSVLSFKDKIKMYNKNRYDSIKDKRAGSDYHKSLKEREKKFRRERYLYLKSIKKENDN